MKKIAGVSALCVWMVGATTLLAAWWLRNPDQLAFINLPESAWLYLIRLFNASCCERVADVELLVALVFGFLATSVATLMGFLLWQRGKRLTCAWSRRH
ncbi:MAG: hypothetical protein WD057_11655 [Aquisalimonadaceae bacterium]